MNLVVYAKAAVNPTEDEDKVVQALLNLFPSASIIRGEGEVLAKVETVEGLQKLRMLVRSRRIRNTVRSLLSKGMEDGRIIFYLNKQAAAVGKLSFYERGEIMALGPIEVVVETDQPSEFIKWLTE